jgi:hypothetical protein
LIKRGKWEDGIFIELEIIEKEDKVMVWEDSEDEREKAIYKIYYDDEGFCTYPDGTRYKGGLENGIPHG